MEFKFTFADKEYILNEENLDNRYQVSLITQQ